MSLQSLPSDVAHPPLGQTDGPVVGVRHDEATAASGGETPSRSQSAKNSIGTHEGPVSLPASGGELASVSAPASLALAPASCALGAVESHPTITTSTHEIHPACRIIKPSQAAQG